MEAFSEVLIEPASAIVLDRRNTPAYYEEFGEASVHGPEG